MRGMSTLIEVAANVYTFPHDPDRRKIQPSVGVVLSADATLLYDCGNGTRHARQIQQALDAIHAPPVTHIVYSHWHWDHVFGACLFPGAAIIGHTRTREHLKEYNKRPWTPESVAAQIPEKPWYAAILDAIDDWDAFHVVPPAITFDHPCYTFRFGAFTLEIEHVGGKHSDDSVVLKVVEPRVMFLGDSYYPRADGIDREYNAPMIEHLKAAAYTIYIDGHRGQVFR